jgi:hypothetical protein
MLATTDTDSWEPPEAVKGAIAHSLFYMDVRYEGDRPNEQNLKLTDTTGQISSSTNFMDRLQTLLAWHQGHPVDDAERRRNDLIFQYYQGNRNPFIDHPEWVILIFNGDAPVITNQPENLAVYPGESATFTVGASGAGHLLTASILRPPLAGSREKAVLRMLCVSGGEMLRKVCRRTNRAGAPVPSDSGFQASFVFRT